MTGPGWAAWRERVAGMQWDEHMSRLDGVLIAFDELDAVASQARSDSREAAWTYALEVWGIKISVRRLFLLRDLERLTRALAGVAAQRARLDGAWDDARTDAHELGESEVDADAARDRLEDLADECWFEGGARGQAASLCVALQRQLQVVFAVDEYRLFDVFCEAFVDGAPAPDWPSYVLALTGGGEFIPALGASGEIIANPRDLQVYIPNDQA